MTSAAPSASAIAAECRSFCRYLADLDPSEYVQTCYARAWTSAAEPERAGRYIIDRALLAVARRGRVPARMADAYARSFRPRCPLRRRLILLLAILENAPPTAALLTSPREGPALAIAAAMAGTLVASLGCLLAGIVLLGPLHLISGIAGGWRSVGSERR